MDNAPEVVRVELQILRGSLRQLSRHRRRLQRELAMAQLWQRGRTLTTSAKWLLLAVAAQREREIAKVTSRITQLEWKLAGLLARFSHDAIGRHEIPEPAGNEISGILLKTPGSRHHSKS